MVHINEWVQSGATPEFDQDHLLYHPLSACIASLTLNDERCEHEPQPCRPAQWGGGVRPPAPNFFCEKLRAPAALQPRWRDGLDRKDHDALEIAPSMVP